MQDLSLWRGKGKSTKKKEKKMTTAKETIGYLTVDSQISLFAQTYSKKDVIVSPVTRHDSKEKGSIRGSIFNSTQKRLKHWAFKCAL